MVKMTLKNGSFNEKSKSRRKATAWVAIDESSSMKSGIKEFTKINENTTSYSMNGMKAKAGTPVQQEADLALNNLKLKKLGQSHDEVLFPTDRRFKQNKANDDRIILKDEYYETGSLKNYQILIAGS